MNTQAIVIATFGTSHEDTEEKTIIPIVKAVRRIFNEFDVRVAFTSHIIIRKLAKMGRKVPTPAETVAQLHEEGFSHVIVQPLLFMNGHEYHEKVTKPLEPWHDRFEGFVIGAPLLTSDEDIDMITDLITDLSQYYGGEKMVLMGHGTDHPADRLYARIQAEIDARKVDAHIATVEGQVQLRHVFPRLEQAGASRIHLAPLMLTAGEHAKNDMAGPDPDSWKSILTSAGLTVIAHLRGLGEYFRLQRIVVDHIRASKRILFPDRYARMQAAAKRKRTGVPRKEIPWFPTIAEEKCSGCGFCYLYCPKHVYTYDHGRRVAVATDPYACVINCSKCAGLCPSGAISFPDVPSL
jgi:sirohydrochlorin cobaltochelatase